MKTMPKVSRRVGITNAVYPFMMRVKPSFGSRPRKRICFSSPDVLTAVLISIQVSGLPAP